MQGTASSTERSSPLLVDWIGAQTAHLPAATQQSVHAWHAALHVSPLEPEREPAVPLTETPFLHRSAPHSASSDTRVESPTRPQVAESAGSGTVARSKAVWPPSQSAIPRQQRQNTVSDAVPSFQCSSHRLYLLISY